MVWFMIELRISYLITNEFDNGWISTGQLGHAREGLNAAIYQAMQHIHEPGDFRSYLPGCSVIGLFFTYAAFERGAKRACG
jgi:hypothetical protein